MEKEYYLSKLLPIAAYMCISCCMLGYYKPGYKEDNEGARTGGEGKGYIATALRIKIKFRRHNLPPNLGGAQANDRTFFGTRETKIKHWCRVSYYTRTGLIRL